MLQVVASLTTVILTFIGCNLNHNIFIIQAIGLSVQHYKWLCTGHVVTLLQNKTVQLKVDNFTQTIFRLSLVRCCSHRHLGSIDGLTVHTACLVCCSSSVNGHSKRKRKRKEAY
jgi:hypothetical protein